MASASAADVVRFSELSQTLTYKAQAVWCMNGFWGDVVNPDEANRIYAWWEHFVKLDAQQTPPKGKDGNELDQFWSAKFLEDVDTALPALQRKAALKTIDLDNNGRMSLLEYATWKFKKSVHAVATAPQGENKEEIERAQRMVDEASALVAAMQAREAEAERSLEEQKRALAAQEAAEIEVKAAQAAVQVAVDEIKAQEAAYNAKIAELEEKSKTGGAVAKGRAANELAQLKSEDPLPLRKAKITQEAALKRAEKASAAAEVATLMLADKTREAEAAKRAAEAAVAEAEAKLNEASAALEEAKKAPGASYGDIWWMQREMFEMDKSLPRAKQRFDHLKPFWFDPTA